MEAIIASGPVIIEKGKLLVNKDEIDDFYKLPGGKIKIGESAEECCKREVKEEINGDIEIIKPLSPMIIWKKNNVGESMPITLLHYKAKLKNKKMILPGKGIIKIEWLKIEDIKAGKYKVGPNIPFLIEKGDII